MKSNRHRSHVLASPVGLAHPSGRPWFARFIIASVVLAAMVGAAGLFGQWALGSGWFDSVDAFVIDADPDRPLTAFFVAVTWLGTTTGFAIVSLAMLCVLLLMRKLRGAAALLASTLTGVFANDFIKDWVARERPVHAGIVEAGGYSFMSGHALLATATFGLFLYLLVKDVESAWLRWLLGAASILFVGLVGFSRIYLGVHYTSDVLAGHVLGVIWMAAWLWVFRPPGAKQDRR